MNKLCLPKPVTAVLLFSLLVPMKVFPLVQSNHTTRVDGRIRLIGNDAGPVRVRLQRLGETIFEQFSINHRFEFREVPLGLYTLVVDAPGYESSFRYVDVPGDPEILVELGENESARRDDPPTTSILESLIPSAARREFAGARRKMQSGDCKGALKQLARAIKIFSRYADALNASGTCHAQFNETVLAEKFFKEASSLTSSVYPALNLAEIYVKQNRIAEAEEVLTSAIRRNPFEGDGYFGLAALRFAQDRITEAEELAQQAHDRQRHTADVHLLLAKIHLALGRNVEESGDLQLYVSEAGPSPLRDRVKKSLDDVQRNKEGGTSSK